MRTATRRFALRQADLDDASCLAPEGAAAVLRDHPAITIALEHRVHGVTAIRLEFAATLRQDDDEWWFDGVQWPDDVRPGVLVTVAWRPARDEVVVRTGVLDEPLRIDGVAYYHEYDPEVVTRECRPGPSNRGQVLAAVRRLGRVYEDGTALFPEADLVRRSGLGRGKRGTFLLRNAVDQLIREGFVTRVAGSVDADGQPSYPAVDGEEPVGMLFYAPLIEPAALPDDGEHGTSDRRDHWVSGFVRKLPPGAQPSPRQLSLHQQAVDSEQVSEPLAPGYTFVKKHHRNG
ncbi:hypothetical protein KZZ52_24345 [Dactylosporangium sp. AC04546]|uniref:hypothetical protein n=1 Tax=Dactylosporangium sp. AC04546 TaxID=2862460 RepID=UPI001EDE816B|nr:hypothetical protein [Dactylosporangium sp. AC04546]WVK88406.1 hypothetical protein KZZ52_24345 [Dactylosporangium sp. AC04546]